MALSGVLSMSTSRSPPSISDRRGSFKRHPQPSCTPYVLLMMSPVMLLVTLKEIRQSVSGTLEEGLSCIWVVPRFNTPVRSRDVCWPYVNLAVKVHGAVHVQVTRTTSLCSEFCGKTCIMPFCKGSAKPFLIYTQCHTVQHKPFLYIHCAAAQAFLIYTVVQSP